MKLAVPSVDVVLAFVLSGHLNDVGVETSGAPTFLTIHYVHPLRELLNGYS